MKSETILHLINQKQNIILESLSQKLTDNYTDSDIIDIINSTRKNNLFFNGAIVDKMLDLIQLLNDEDNILNLELDEIGTVYQKLIEIHPYDISIFESMYYFYDSVLDRPEEIKEKMLDRIKHIKDKVNSIEQYIMKDNEKS